MTADEAAAGRLSELQDRKWLAPAIADAAPTTPANRAKIAKNPVAPFPIGKKIGENCAGTATLGPTSYKTKPQLIHVLKNVYDKITFHLQYYVPVRTFRLKFSTFYLH